MPLYKRASDFCKVCGLIHLDGAPLCDPVEYRYGKIITEADGTLTYEPPGGVMERRSSNANDAEAEGKMPLTRAIPIVAYHANVSREEAKAALIKTYDREWHHTGILGRRTRYFSVVDAVEYLKRKEGEHGTL